MGLRKSAAVGVGTVALVVMGAGPAMAGEVKGPSTGPGVHNTNITGALLHAHSPCAASGLNDYDVPANGQVVSRVQTAADSWRYYGYPKGAVGTLCNPTGGHK